MKKVLVFVFVLLGFFSLNVAFLHAEELEEGEEPIIEEPVVEEPVIGKVVIGECQYGSATVNVEEGEVGEIVTIYPNAQFLCSLKAVKVNGVDIAKNGNGEYQFALVEGDEVLNVYAYCNLHGLWRK